jgi:hypothetical protein
VSEPNNQPAVVEDPSLADLSAYRTGQTAEPSEQPTEQPTEQPAAEGATEGAEAAESTEQAEADPASTAGKELAKKRNSLQARIDEERAKRGEAERKAQALEARIAALEGRQQPQQPAPTKPSFKFEKAKPVVSEFETYEEFAEALTEWKIEERDERRAFEANQAETERRNQAYGQQNEQRWNGYTERFRALQSENPELLQKVAPFLEAVPPETTLYDALVDSEVFAQVAEYLMDNPEEIDRIGALTPVGQLRAFGRIEARFAGESKAEAQAEQPAKVVTRAPAPVTTVGGGGSGAGASADPSKMQSVSEWRKVRKQFGG